MFKTTAVLHLLLLIGLAQGCVTPNASMEPDDPPLQDSPTAPETLEVSSPDFQANGRLDPKYSFNQFGCTGQNTRPTLEIANVPEGTKSFALLIHDPDAPTGVGFFHQVLVDVPAKTRRLDGDEQGRELHTDYGTPGYGGPCPPPGLEHRYVFSVYALDIETLPVPEGGTGALVRFMLQSHTLAYGRLMGTFQR